LFEQIGIDFKIRREQAIVRDGFFELPRVAAGEDARPAGAAFGIRSERVFEQHPFAGNAVEIWRLDPSAAVGSGVSAAVPVVEDDKQDVGASLRLSNRR